MIKAAEKTLIIKRHGSADYAQNCLTAKGVRDITAFVEAVSRLKYLT